MRRRLLRIENLLLLVIPLPLVGPIWDLWASYYGQNRYEDFTFAGDIGLFDYFAAWFGGPVLQSIPVILPLYFLHYSLRAINRRNKLVCYIHVLGTVIFILYATVLSATSVVPGWHTAIYTPFYMGAFDFGSFIYFLLQFAFIIFCFITVHRWRKSPD